jgi:hypothetical protein
MNASSPSNDYSPRHANHTGVLNSVLNVLAFITLLAFGIASTYYLG